MKLPTLRVISRRGNTPTYDGRDATNLFRPREDIVPGIQSSFTEIIEVGLDRPLCFFSGVYANWWH